MLGLRSCATSFCLVGYLCWACVAQAQLTEYTWNGATGAQDWQQSTNWTPAGFPNDPQHVANLAVDLSGNLTLNIGTTGNDVTIAGLNIGGTAGAVTTDLVSSGAALRFQNSFKQALADADFNNNGIVDGPDFLTWQRNFGTTAMNKFFGDANGDTMVDGVDLGIWEANYGLNALGLNSGQPIITTGGIAGTINRINTNAHILGTNLQIRGSSNLTIGGDLSYENDTPGDGGILSSINSTTAGITTTIEGNISLINQFDGMGGAFGLNTIDGSQGTLIVNGVIDDGAASTRLWIGPGSSEVALPLNTVRLNSANTHSGGVTLRRVNLELGDDAALGTGSLQQQGPNNQFGFNLIPIGGDRTLANDIVVQHNTSFKGNQNLTLSGDITQSNSKSFVNLLAAGKSLTLTGRLDIWSDGEALVREFVFDGTGTTLVTGLIRDDPDGSGELRRILKSGTGVLKINVEPGGNQHGGRTSVLMGNLHYANNDSVNQGAGLILSRGGAVGVDTGVANNTTFASKIDPASTGGLMLAASDAAAPLNFTTTLARAAKMTVAAPETGLTYTGTITPANSTYGLGGGSGTLTLPNVQLTGANALEVRNGGTVELLGDNTYTGPTAILTKYTSSRQEQAAADTDSANVATGVFYDRLVAPTLVVDDLADGGSASSIGSASSDAANLLIQGSTLKYTGAGDSTNRLFTIGTGGATIDASGTGAVVFSNAGTLGRDDAESRQGSVNNFANLADRPKDGAAVYIHGSTSPFVPGDTSDIVVGMSVSDTGGKISVDAKVTGIADDGYTVRISPGVEDGMFALNTTISFGTVERTLTLAGTNGGNNTLASVISDSPLGGVVAVNKIDSGKWVLTGSNSYTGETTVTQGILSLTNPNLDDSSTVNLLTGGTLNLDFSGNDTIASLFLNGAEQEDGLWGAVGNGSATFTSNLITGGGLLNVNGAALQAIAATVPEPSALLLASMAVFGFAGSRRRTR